MRKKGNSHNHIWLPLFLVSLLFLCSSQTFAGQTSQAKKYQFITGIVKDANGKPVPFAAICFKGTTSGCVATMDGKYSIRVPNESNVILEVSSLGYKTQSVKINGRKKINIVLIESVKELDEVVATGYQTIAKERATGSYDKVDVKSLSQRPSVSLTESLQGLSPGVVVSGSNITIRGKNSLSAGSNPLLVVDGFVVDTDLGSLNPDIIESITVLKDAASTAIYGARAANGVIVVTTKKAKTNKLQVSVNSFFKTTDKMDLPYRLNILSSKDQVEYDKLGVSEGFLTVFPKPTAEKVIYRKSLGLLVENKLGNISDAELNEGLDRLSKLDYSNDYNKYLLRNSLEQKHSITISGKDSKNSYRASFLYYNNTTGYKHNSSHKYNLSLQDIFSFNKSIKYTVGITFNNGYNSLNGGFKQNTISPYSRLVDDNGEYVNMPLGTYYDSYTTKMQSRMPYKNWKYNLLQEIRNTDNSNTSRHYRIQNKLDIVISPTIKSSTLFQYEGNSASTYGRSNEQTFTVRDLVNTFSKKEDDTSPTSNYIADGFPKGDMVTLTSNNNDAYNIRQQFSFNKTFKNGDSFTALIGGEVIASHKVDNPTKHIFGYDNDTFVGQPFDFTKELTYSDVNQTKTPVLSKMSGGSFNIAHTYNRYISAFTNASYTLRDKYTLSGSLRTDASNYVSENTRDKFAPFWSLGGIWNLKKEKFLKDEDKIGRLSLRASYGVVGLPASRSNLSTLTTVGYGTYNRFGNSYPVAGISSYGLSELDWEKTYTTNVGLDFDLFNREFFGKIDVYHKISKGVISPKTVSIAINPTETVQGNFSEVRNNGVELQLGTNQRISNSISYNGVLNLSFNSNKLLNYKQRSNRVNSYEGSGWSREGYPMDALNVYRYKGVSDKGAPIIEIKGKDLTIDHNIPGNETNNIQYDKGETVNSFLKYAGTTSPKSYATLINSFTIRNFDFSFIVSGSFGNKFLKDNMPSPSMSPFVYATSKEVKKGWTPTHHTIMPQTTPIAGADNSLLKSYGSQWASYYNLGSANVRDASVIRLDEVYLGYNLPKGFLLKNANLTFYAQAKNLGMLWSGNKEHIDPSYRPGTAKLAQSYLIGFKLNF